MSEAQVNDSVKLLKTSNYANSSFQQEGFGHLKVDDTGQIIKDYEDGTYLVEFMDEGSKKSNIYSMNDIYLV